MDDLDERKDPYRSRSVGDGKGFDLTRPGDEQTIGRPGGMGGGLGTRFRGKNAPTDFSQHSEDEYSSQKDEDIPVTDHHLLDEYVLKPKSDATELISFYDTEGPFMADILDNRKNEPVGPHNMDKIKDPYHKTKKRLN